MPREGLQQEAALPPRRARSVRLREGVSGLSPVRDCPPPRAYRGPCVCQVPLLPLSGKVQLSTPLLDPPLLPLGPAASGTVDTLEVVHTNTKVWWRGGGPHKESSVTVIHCDVSCGEPEGAAEALASSGGLIQGSSWEAKATEGAFRSPTFTKPLPPFPQSAYPPKGVPSVHRCQLAPRRPRRPTKPWGHCSFGHVGGSGSLFGGFQDGALPLFS